MLSTTNQRVRRIQVVHLAMEPFRDEAIPAKLRFDMITMYTTCRANGRSCGEGAGVGGEGLKLKGGRELVGSATLQVCVPDAPFPPPFPTSKPYRAYLANMAGLEGGVQKGIG